MKCANGKADAEYVYMIYIYVWYTMGVALWGMHNNKYCKRAVGQVIVQFFHLMMSKGCKYIWGHYIASESHYAHQQASYKKTKVKKKFTQWCGGNSTFSSSMNCLK